MADFKIAVDITMDDDHEGGFQNMKGDKGNWTGGAVGVGVLKGTKYGISAAQFPDLDIANLTTDVAASIYRAKYWPDLYDQIDNQGIANKLFDVGVLFGQHTAVKMLQISMSHQSMMIVSDGVFGPNTLAAVNQLGSLPVYKQTLIAHVINVITNNPGEAQYSQDWMRRINS